MVFKKKIVHLNKTFGRAIFAPEHKKSGPEWTALIIRGTSLLSLLILYARVLSFDGLRNKKIMNLFHFF